MADEKKDGWSMKNLGIVALVAFVVVYLYHHGTIDMAGLKGAKSGTFKKDGSTPNVPPNVE